MAIINDNDKIVSRFQEIINNKEIKFIHFKNDFNFEMTKTSCETLLNLNELVREYRLSYLNEGKNGEKLILLFGLLQGLFVAVDSLYTIGRVSNLNKLMININQNEDLREIKHIRNDVVGHPTYRYYANTIGFCTLDFENINASHIKYFIYTFENNQTIIEQKDVDLLQVIDSYYCECNSILSQTIQFFEMKQESKEINISHLISILGLRYYEGKLDLDLLDRIEKEYSNLFKLAKNANNRVLWRIGLIRSIGNYEQDDYIKYLTLTEMFKLYSLMFNLEKQFNKKLKFKFVKFEKNREFTKLRSKIQKIKKNNFEINNLHDSRHPLYEEYMKTIFDAFNKDDEVHSLIQWMKEKVKEKNHNLLYMIGSDLKK